MGEPLRDLQVPANIVAQIVAALCEDEQNFSAKAAERVRLRTRLTMIRDRMDAAYNDKLDGKINEDLWQRKSAEWIAEEQELRLALNGLAAPESTSRGIDAEKVFELANKGLFSVSCTGTNGESQIAQNAVSELFGGSGKRHSC
ncbi:MAG TPA: hypothetical protein VGJ21_11790 [Terracidiphilus sp.]